MEEWDIILNIGKNEEYHTLSDVVSNIPLTASQVLIIIHSDLSQNTDINIPTNRSIKKIEITSFQNKSYIIDFSGCNFFANGIFVIIDSAITFINCFLFGGGKAEHGICISCPSSYLQIKGVVDYVFGGGYANGSKSISNVNETTIELVGGTVSYLYGGGFAIHQGVVNSGNININLDAHSAVTGILNGGNFLAGRECNSIIDGININISGKVKGIISLAGYGVNNSSIRIQNSICLNVIEGKLFGEIFEKSSNSTDFITNNLRIRGEINSKYQNLLAISRSDIQFVNPKSIGKKGKILNSSNYKTSNYSGSNKAGDVYQVNIKKKKNIWIYITTCVILLMILSFFISLQNNNNKKTLSQNKLISVTDNKDVIQNEITDSIIITATKKTALHSTKYISLTQTNTLTGTLTLTPTYTQTEELSFVPFESITPFLSDTQLETTPLVSVESVTPISSESSLKITVETATNEPTESKIRKTGIIYVKTDSGTIFYRIPVQDQENIIRTLLNNTEVDIVSGPTYRNGNEWYEIYCQQFDRSGWVISSSVKFETN